MKKTYINPNIEVIKIQTAGMLAVSGKGLSEETVEPQSGDAIGPGMAHFDEYDW